MELENLEQFDSFINKKQTVAVAWVSTWCPPCKMLKPILYEFCDEYQEDEILIVNTDDFKSLAQKYNITHVPQIWWFKENKALYIHEGFIDYDEIHDKFEELK